MIIISPYSKPTISDNKPSPKNYPYWPELIKIIREKMPEQYILQVGVSGETDLGCDCFLQNLPLEVLKTLIKGCDIWISVDNFFHHLASIIGKRGIVIFSLSDPLIFGDPNNINILKDRKYLRADQFNFWDNVQPNNDAFVEPEIIFEIISECLR